MEPQKSSSGVQSSGVANPAMSSCRKKKSDDTTSFLADLRNHMDEFVNASMDEHKTCFAKTIKKMFVLSKIVAERNSAVKEDNSNSAVKEVESHLPLAERNSAVKEDNSNSAVKEVESHLPLQTSLPE